MAIDLKQKIEAANAEVFNRIVAADPVLVDIRPAGEVVPRLGERMILHAGPPVDWEQMSGAQKGAVLAMTIFEGWAGNPEQAEELLSKGGLDGEWFTAPAPAIVGLYLPGYGEDDGGLDMGDSAITETVGWGGFVLGGAPGILSLVGGTPEEALNYSREMRNITVDLSPDFRIPALGFEGTAVGIDIRKVVQTNILPIIDTAIAHKNPGHPIIGAGLVRPPMECFHQALRSFAAKYSTG